MRYVFFGSPRFAEVFLEKLIESGIRPELAVVSPEKATGRKGEILRSPVFELAKKYSIDILQPEKPILIAEQLRNVGADFFIVAAYAKILPQEIIDIPKIATLGVHPSLLPRHRGASPIQMALLSGDIETGTTIYRLDSKMDHGEIISSKTLEISNEDDYLTLERKLAVLGAEQVVRIAKSDYANIPFAAQDESLATFTKKLTLGDGQIDLQKLLGAIRNGEGAFILHRKIAALSKEPGAWTVWHDKRVKLLQSKLVDGKLNLQKIQLEGKNPIVPDKNFFFN